MNEGQLIKDMEADYKEAHFGAFWRKIHGDKYMAGMPDVLAALPDVAALTEFKWEESDNLLLGPFADLVVQRLTGLQFAELQLLGAVSHTCPLRARVLIGFPVEDHQGLSYEMACGFDLADVPKYRTFSAADLANVAVHARVTPAEKWQQKWQWPKERFPLGGPIGMELQLRLAPSREKWRSAALVLGLRRYKAFEIRKVHDSEAWEAMYGEEL